MPLPPHRRTPAPSAPLPLRAGLPALASALLASATVLAAPARALERIELRIPLLETSFTVKVAELRDPRALLAGNSDLAELDRVTRGEIGRRLEEAFLAPLPLEVKTFAERSVGAPLLDQALLIVSSVGQVEGIPEPLRSEALATTIQRAAADGSLTLLELLEAVPGTTLTVDLGRFRFQVDRLRQQQAQGNALVAELPAARAAGSLTAPGPRPVRRLSFRLPVTHRQEPLRVEAMVPGQGANGRLVVISHGLWDDPASFEGWASHLVSHGYTVLLPAHPGSDQSQQQAMLAGQSPPPSPEDLRLRPLDVIAAIDAAEGDALEGLPAGLRTDPVVVLGHSWGATTALQLAGVRPSARRLERHCHDLRDPERNLSWVLQCSFLSSADRSDIRDPRVRAVVAVSPPTRLLFDTGSSSDMNARVLMVSGTRDWIVPSGPEAIQPMAQQARNAGGGHRLVLARGGDHFNLRSPLGDGGGPLRGLLLGWVNGAFAAGAAAAPGPQAPDLLPPDGWGDPSYPLVDVTGRLRTLTVDTRSAGRRSP